MVSSSGLSLEILLCHVNILTKRYILEIWGLAEKRSDRSIKLPLPLSCLTQTPLVLSICPVSSAGLTFPKTQWDTRSRAASKQINEYRSGLHVECRKQTFDIKSNCKRSECRSGLNVQRSFSAFAIQSTATFSPLAPLLMRSKVLCTSGRPCEVLARQVITWRYKS